MMFRQDRSERGKATRGEAVFFFSRAREPPYRGSDRAVAVIISVRSIAFSTTRAGLRCVIRKRRRRNEESSRKTRNKDPKMGLFKTVKACLCDSIIGWAHTLFYTPSSYTININTYLDILLIVLLLLANPSLHPTVYNDRISPSSSL